MGRPILIKNHQQEISLIVNRMRYVLFGIGAMLLVLILQLGNLELIQHARYTTLSKNNWLELIPIEPTRGLIYDRNGVLLAENIPVFSVDIIPNQVNNLQASIKVISTLISLSENDLALFYKQLKQHRRFDEIPLKLALTEVEIARLAENQYRLPGVLIKARLLRHYPAAGRFSHVVGYVGRINAAELQKIDTVNYSASNYIGKLGIEKYYEEDLHGTVGYGQVEKDASGKLVRTFKEIKAIPGKNIYLTIDSHLQQIAEEALETSRGAVVAIQPDTGEILAMVSRPTYDPNLFVQGVSQENYDQLKTAKDRPLFNRVLRGLYPLASTIKPYLALEALRSAIITPSFTIEDPGWFQLPNSTHLFHDWRPYGHGRVDLDHAIMSSCDTYFYTLATKMGIQRIDQILDEFGFGSKTGIDLDGELPGTLPSPLWKYATQKVRWYPGDTVISGIGQGFMRATPLQLAAGTATLANRGIHRTPHLLLRMEAGKIPATKATPPLTQTAVIADEAHWKTVITAMQHVIDSPLGTGFTFGPHEYAIAAKTGTAQVVSNRNKNLPEYLRDHHLIIAFAPVEHPAIAIAIVTENSNRTMAVLKQMLNDYVGKKPHDHPQTARTEHA